MWMRAAVGLFPLCLCAADPAAWVPMRWNSSDPQTLDLLAGNPVNCLLVASPSAEFARAAAGRKLELLAVFTPGPGAQAEAARAAALKIPGIVLEGDFPDDVAAKIRSAFTGTIVELPSRTHIRWDSKTPVIGTWQGVWPGVQVEESGTAKAGPTGSAWIDTNSGFLRSARSMGGATVWIANRPPPRNIITVDRYQQAIADAAASGGRWVVALDDDFEGRLLKREETALRDWKKIAATLEFYESHPDWRAMRPVGRLALVQDPAKGGLISGGILDMIAAKHTPVRPIPRQQLSASALEGAKMAVNIDAEALTPEQRDTLKKFTAAGNTLLTGPPEFHDRAPSGSAITLDKAELERLNDIWRDVQNMVGRRNLGVRLFNVSSMLSNLVASPDGRQTVVHLVNYSGYRAENIAVHFLGTYKQAVLAAPGQPPKTLEIYPTEEGGGVDVPEVGVCAAVILQ